MAIKVFDRFPGANARILSVRNDAPAPEVVFTPDPCGGTEALWFNFRIHDPSPPANSAPESLKLSLVFFDTLLGGCNPATIRPVLRERGKAWSRLRSPEVKTEPDGLQTLSWSIPYPIEPHEFALCMPYGTNELSTVMAQCRGYWTLNGIGLTQGGRILQRLSNDILKDCKACPNPHGLYIVARQHAGETPGSWVLDGMLSAFSRAKPVNWCVWVVPFANLDDVVSGAYGKDPFPHDLNRAWGDPPMRHETLVMRKDIHRWAQRCKPQLVLDLHAPGGSEDEGVYAFTKQDAAPDVAKANQAWLNLFAQALGSEYASETFARVANYPSRWPLPRLVDFVHDAIGTAALSLETPYCSIRGTTLLQKNYREIGGRLASAILGRWGRG
ncbi:MAG: hypothetical protein ACOX9C_07585 [Kiritimatiellia bacterium]